MQLTSEQIDLIKQIASGALGSQHRLYLYGSRARNNADAFSDVDLCISGAPLSLVELAQLKEKFSESNLPYFVDIVQKEHLSEEFWALIKHELVGIPL